MVSGNDDGCWSHNLNLLNEKIKKIKQAVSMPATEHSIHCNENLKSTCPLTPYLLTKRYALPYITWIEWPQSRKMAYWSIYDILLDSSPIQITRTKTITCISRPTVPSVPTNNEKKHFLFFFICSNVHWKLYWRSLKGQR